MRPTPGHDIGTHGPDMTPQHLTDRDFEPSALAALDSGSTMLLTGNAGTGKSTLLNHWIRTRDQPGVALVAPTGIAALNIGGETIHRFLHLEPGLSPEQAADKARHLNADRRRLYRSLRTIIMDEVSMCRADLMDTLDRFLQAARNNETPFGGVRLIMVGDLLQLPPVVTREEAKLFHGGRWASPWAFDSTVLTELGRNLTVVNLTVVHRQNDPAFIRLLDHARTGTADRHDLDTLSRRVSPPDRNAIVLASTRARVDRINRRALDRLDGHVSTYTASMNGEWSRTITPAPPVINLKVGARVMMCANDPAGLWVNGTRGTVVDFENDLPVIRLEDGDITTVVGRHEWNVKRNYAWRAPADDPEHPGEWMIGRKTIGSYSQLPLRLGWAVTIHKSQGLTFDRMNLDLGDRPLFAPGMGYVALSRVRTLDGLHLSRPMTMRDLTVDPAPLRFLKEHRAEEG